MMVQTVKDKTFLFLTTGLAPHPPTRARRAEHVLGADQVEKGKVDQASRPSRKRLGSWSRKLRKLRKFRDQVAANEGLVHQVEVDQCRLGWINRCLRNLEDRKPPRMGLAPLPPERELQGLEADQLAERARQY
mmetsp:Transcript_69899/g.167792  ORF Transcript_69899/g.167792 Transcript_69899/m.167792 type:complete len:133 (-) Transcript_69899:892-1290(-)